MLLLDSKIKTEIEGLARLYQQFSEPDIHMLKKIRHLGKLIEKSNSINITCHMCNGSGLIGDNLEACIGCG